MTSGAEPPQKKTPRKPRQFKPATNPPPSNRLVTQDATVQTPTPVRVERRRPTSRRTQPKDIPETKDQEPQTTAPSLPQTIIQDIKTVPSGLSDSPASNPTVSSRNTRSKKSPNKQQVDQTAISTTSKSRNDRSPRAEERSSSMTPVKKSNTTSQAYAGPTFHASPAPSALPIPRFFSKSVPVTESGTSLTSMMQDDTSEGSSNKSEDSPTIRNSLRVAEQPMREASPLDLFFNADREEKAKRSPLFMNGSSAQSSEQVANAPKSVSPIPDHIRHHSRNNSGPSTNGMFPLEMDASEPSFPLKTTKLKSSDRGSNGLDFSPPVRTISTTQSEENAKAKTQALKNLLLLSAQPQDAKPATTTGTSTTASLDTGSPVSSPLPHHNYYLRSNSASSTPRLSADGPINFNHPKSPDSPSSHAKQSPVAVARGITQPRPLSSHLRQEVKLDTGSEPNELPSTPTPSRVYHVHDPTISQNSNSIQLNGKVTHFAPAVQKFRPEDALKAATGQDSSSFDTIEHALRKVLKLGSFDSDSGTGVRS
ncbi:hypothetical protein MMC13_001621 [Lambiella insularis]|nr:hypothetical protein [Lambiella insularis]